MLRLTSQDGTELLISLLRQSTVTFTTGQRPRQEPQVGLLGSDNAFSDRRQLSFVQQASGFLGLA